MINLELLYANSLEELKALIPVIADKWQKEVVVGVRGPNLTELEQLSFTKFLGDYIGWFPNQSSSFSQRYQENHDKNIKKSKTTGDEIALNWHLEYVNYPVPILGATWNMIKFLCDTEKGKTYFVDSSKIFKSMDSSMREFALRCVGTWHSISGVGPYYAATAQQHPINSDLVLRIDISNTVSELSSLYTVDNRPPTDEERLEYVELRDYFLDQIHNNEDIRVVHRWQQGDILIPNMFKAVHAVTGGFESKDREFIGYWAFPSEPPEDNLGLNWLEREGS